MKLLSAGFSAVAFVIITTSAIAQQVPFHTPPDKWAEPRNYHTPFEQRYFERMVITRDPIMHQYPTKVSSPNSAYWFSFTTDSPTMVNLICQGAEYLTEEQITDIYIFAERPYLIKVSLINHYPNFKITVRWANEKLLYLEVWWGRILGSYFIIDVEQETPIQCEMVHYGANEFIQWQQGKN